MTMNNPSQLTPGSVQQLVRSFYDNTQGDLSQRCFPVMQVVGGQVGQPQDYRYHPIYQYGLLGPAALAPGAQAQMQGAKALAGAPPAAYGQPASAYNQGVSSSAYGAPQNSSYGAPSAQAAPSATPGQGYYSMGAAAPPVSAYGAPQSAYGQPAPRQPLQEQQAQVSAYGAPSNRGLPGALAPRYDSRGATAVNANAPQLTSIKDIGPYFARWTIQGRCTTKSDLRHYNRNGKEGCVFNFDLLDATGEVRIVGFGDQAIGFHPRVEPGRMYRLSRASAKVMESSKRKWNQTGHDCEVYLERDTVLEEVPDAEVAATSAAIPRVLLKPLKIAEVEAVAAGEIIDVIGIIESAEEASQITRRDSSTAEKRNLVLRDDSGRSVELTLWGEKAETPGRQAFEAVREGRRPVLSIKSAKVGDFNGKSLSSLNSSAIHLDATDIPGVSELRSWYDGGGAGAAPQALSQRGGGGKADRRATVAMIRDEMIGHGGREWVRIIGVISSLRSEPMTYPACPLDFNGRTCNKKMQPTDDGTGQYHCARCMQSAMPEWRYMLVLGVWDFESSLDNLSVFGETGESVMGMSAAQAKELEVDSTAFERFMADRIQWRHKAFKIKCAEDEYEGTKSMKYTISACEDVSYAAESKVFIEMIEDMMNGREVTAMKPKPKEGMGMGTQLSYGASLGGAAVGGYGAPSSGFGGGAAGGFGVPQMVPQQGGPVAMQGGMAHQIAQHPGYMQQPVQQMSMQQAGMLSQGGHMMPQGGQGGYQQQGQYGQSGQYQQQVPSNTAFLEAPAFQRR